MAKPLKKGLHYFPKDTDFYDDYKIIDLMSVYGPVGSTIYDYILTQVYNEGYYLEIPVDKLALLAVRAVGAKWITKELAINVITYCGDIGLFRVDLLEQGIITSAAIQRRFQEAKKSSRRKFQKGKYWILDEIEEEVAYPLLSAPQKADKCTETGDKCTETHDNCTFIDTKEKKRKGKKRKESGDGLNAHLSAQISDVFDTFERCGFLFNGHAAERILEMCDEYPPEWVAEAIRRATDRGVKKLSYIEGILAKWSVAGAMDDRKKVTANENDGGDHQEASREWNGIKAL